MTLVFVAIFLFGLILGSFFNVLIDRLPNGQNPFKGRSRCDYCKKTLSPIELVPLLSYVVQRGRCRSCHERLSLQYPLIELLTGCILIVLFLVVAPISSELSVNFQKIAELFSVTVFSFSLLVIFFSDLKYQIIPDEMVVSATLGSLLYIAVTGQSFFLPLLSGVGSALFFGAIYLFTRGRGMGFGDVKLALPLGVFLGFPGTVFAIYIAFLTGGIVSLILILFKLKRLKSTIAFGPFLIVGLVSALLWKNLLMDWYNGFFR